MLPCPPVLQAAQPEAKSKKTKKAKGDAAEEAEPVAAAEEAPAKKNKKSKKSKKAAAEEEPVADAGVRARVLQGPAGVCCWLGLGRGWGLCMICREPVGL